MLPTFIDLFAGCGGLSLGLLQSKKWRGMFAIEKNADAFSTLSHNLIDKRGHNKNQRKYRWPDWLPKQPFEISEFIKQHQEDLESLQGQITLIAGGPPCQGFSYAGKRDLDDPRNQLFKHHLELVGILKPQMVLIENVKGIASSFCRPSRTQNYAEAIYDELEGLEYTVSINKLQAVNYGVPQNRERYFILGVSEEMKPFFTTGLEEALNDYKAKLSRIYKIDLDQEQTVEGAISDLETKKSKLQTCSDTVSGKFKEIIYTGPKTAYQEMMHAGMNGTPPNSLRLARHSEPVTKRFKEILKDCRKGISLSQKDRDRLGIKKQSLTPLAPNKPSHTITTLPDDYIHYSEPRIHTVREHARLQSFPDWFEFQGKYTTGGHRRAFECPRYTQVGNAVPPLLARSIGHVLAKRWGEYCDATSK